jgi:PAS domain-containing protein
MAEGKAVMGEIQSILGEIQREEDLRLERLSEQAWSSQRRTDVLVLGATAFLVLGGIAGAWLLPAGGGISERRRAEEALQASQGQLRDLLKGAETQVLELAASEKVLRFQTGVLQSVLNGMSDGVVVVGEDGGLLMSNSAAGRILEGLPATHSSKWVARYGLCLADGTSACPAAEFPLARALRGEEVDHAVLFASTARGLDGAWLSMSAGHPGDHRHHPPQGQREDAHPRPARSGTGQRRSRDRYPAHVGGPASRSPAASPTAGRGGWREEYRHHDHRGSGGRRPSASRRATGRPVRSRDPGRQARELTRRSQLPNPGFAMSRPA